jgi:ABC-type sugar transport system ATPase subunit
MDLLQVLGISRQGRDGFVLQHMHFSQQKTQKIAIAGETGSGKTTLLKIIAGLVQPDEGEVLFEGERVAGPLEKLIPGHPSIAYLSQHFELRNNYRVAEILSYANRLPENMAAEIYGLCEINRLLHRKTDELSGGEKQRIAIARLLVGMPKLLVLDEPFSNLDLSHKQQLKTVLNNIGEELQITCLISSHDPADSLSWAQQLVVLQAGRILQAGSAESIYRKPLTEYVAGLFGYYSLIGDELAGWFRDYFPIHPTGKKIITRPEQFQVVPEGVEDFKGVVEEIYFFGSWYMLQLAVASQTLLVKSETGNFAPDETVGIMIQVNEPCYV